jgi:oligosaccharide repeat unit polymerase
VSAGGTRTRPGAGLWWLSPVGALSLLIPVTLWLTQHLSTADFELFYREPKLVTGSNLALVTVAVLVLASVAQLTARLAPSGTQRRLMPPGDAVPERLRTAARVLFWLTMLGYVAFGASGVARGVRPADIVQAFANQDNYGVNLKGQFGGIAGLTTLTQCGIAFVVVAVHLLARKRDGRLLAQVLLVVVLALLRSYINSERLALIEIAVPAVVIVAMAARRSRHRARRVMARAAPLVLAPLLLLLFAAFEYSRSWQFFKTRTDEPFALFALVRFVGYYATSYNNGYLQMQYGGFPGRLPLNSLAALWDAPGISALNLYDRLSAPIPAASDDLLERFANPEFNNPGGVTTPFVDFGMLGGFLFLALLGIVIGLLYRGFCDGAVTGSLLYPVVLTGLFDLPRYLYWTQGRVVPAWVALIVLAVVLVRAQQRAGRLAARAHRARPAAARPAATLLPPAAAERPVAELASTGARSPA